MNFKILFLIVASITIFFVRAQEVPLMQWEALDTCKPVTILNSDFRETNLFITKDGKRLFFMSDRGGQSWSRISGQFKGKLHYDGDIWVSERKSITAPWQTPRCLPYPINTSYGEDEPFFMDDSVLVFQSWRANWEQSQGPYYKARIKSDTFLFSSGLGGGISAYFRQKMQRYARYATDGISFSADKRLFFVACGVEYDGPMDIYYSRWDAEKQLWSFLEKHPISTEKDERSLFISQDGKYLFFASEAYHSLGGLDIFVAEIAEDGKLTNIRNLGPPINTEADEYSFFWTYDKQEIYFVRNGDIYRCRVKSENLQAPLPLTYELYFEFDKAALSDSAKAQLNEWYKYFSSAQRIIIIGHTDTLGSVIYNARLSLRRARTVREFLIRKGIPPQKIVYLGKGETLLKYTSPSEFGRNRRVEVFLKY